MQHTRQPPHTPPCASHASFPPQGCAHDASDFWPRSVACPECDGLPEEVAHAKQALARGYAVLAVDAADAGTRCFGIHADADATASILLHWLRSQGLQVGGSGGREGQAHGVP